MELAVAPETRFRYEFPHRAEMPAEYIVDNPYLSSTLYKAASLYDDTSSLTRHNAAASDQETTELQSLYLKPFHAAHMVDPRLSDARPSMWTAVCDDDVLMRDLLAVWFRCEYQFTSACQKDYFPEDMVAKRQDFCSSLLVNIVLAYACVGDGPPPCTKESTVLTQTLRSATRASPTAPSTGTPTPCCTTSWPRPSASGSSRRPRPASPPSRPACSSTSSTNLCGLDEIGQAYRIHAIALAHELGFYDGSITAASEKMRKAKIYTA